MSMLPAGAPKSQSEHLADFEDMYSDGREPFDYGARAIEWLRHERVATVARGLGGSRMLDLGCGLGQITRRLLDGPARVVSADLSPTAVARSRRELVRGRAGPPPAVLSASALELPMRDGAFDLVVASDGLVSWHLNADQRVAAVREIARVLAAGGHALLTEYLRPAQWPQFLDELVAGGLEVRTVEGIHDRPFYWFESWIRAVRHWPPARALRRSRALARVLMAGGRLLGSRGCRHLLVVARRP